MKAHEVERLVEMITEDLYRELRAAAPSPADSAARWCTDPLNDTCFRCQRSTAAEILEAEPDRVGALPFLPTTEPGDLPRDLARLIDHTLLKPDATPNDVEQLCHEAVRYRFKSVCVNPVYTRLAAQVVGNSGVLVCTVVGFPLGANVSSIKAAETRQALLDGAREIDMVLPIGLLKAGRAAAVAHDILEVVNAAGDVPVKVILEACLLEHDEKVLACRLARESGAAFVKTSTGFSTGGATVEDIQLLRREVGGQLGVKASGGIRDLGSALEMIRAGANRIGASASVAIVSGS